jgi:hypothetical protein
VDPHKKPGEPPPLQQQPGECPRISIDRAISHLYNQDDAHRNPISEHFRQSALQPMGLK